MKLHPQKNVLLGYYPITDDVKLARLRQDVIG